MLLDVGLRIISHISQSGWILAVIFFYNVVVGIYNVTLHPLSRIPGPFMARFTRYYEFFWCVYLGRSIYYKKVYEMHQKYGPVVRVSPNELSFNSPEDMKRVYDSRSSYAKDPTFYRAFGISHGMFGQYDCQNHREARSKWKSYFAVKPMRKLVDEKVEKLCERVAGTLERDNYVTIQPLLHAMMIDIVSQHTLSEEFSLMDDPYRSEKHIPALFRASSMIWALRSSSIVYGISRLLSALRGGFSPLGGPLDIILTVVC